MRVDVKVSLKSRIVQKSVHSLQRQYSMLTLSGLSVMPSWLRSEVPTVARVSVFLAGGRLPACGVCIRAALSLSPATARSGSRASSQR